MQRQLECTICFVLLQVWISYAQFELSLGTEDSLQKARDVYREGCQSMKEINDKEERLMLLENWKEFEVFLFSSFCRASFIYARQWCVRYSELLFLSQADASCKRQTFLLQAGQEEPESFCGVS